MVLKEAVGSKVVEYFVALKRDFELTHFRQVTTKGMGTAEIVDKERQYYMPLL